MACLANGLVSVLDPVLLSTAVTNTLAEMEELTLWSGDVT
jgi:hypothetical protein